MWIPIREDYSFQSINNSYLTRPLVKRLIMASKMTAPNIAVSIELKVKLPVETSTPKRLITQPPRKAPIIPTIMLAGYPAG